MGLKRLGNLQLKSSFYAFTEMSKKWHKLEGAEIKDFLLILIIIIIDIDNHYQLDSQIIDTIDIDNHYQLALILIIIISSN